MKKQLFLIFLLLSLTIVSFAQWQTDKLINNPVCTAPNIQPLITTTQQLFIASDEKERNIIAYPNPTNQYVHLKLFNLSYSDAVRIFDENGKKLSSFRITKTNKYRMASFRHLFFSDYRRGQQVQDYDN